MIIIKYDDEHIKDGEDCQCQPMSVGTLWGQMGISMAGNEFREWGRGGQVFSFLG